jgi:hypothetical protein
MRTLLATTAIAAGLALAPLPAQAETYSCALLGGWEDGGGGGFGYNAGSGGCAGIAAGGQPALTSGGSMYGQGYGGASSWPCLLASRWDGTWYPGSPLEPLHVDVYWTPDVGLEHAGAGAMVLSRDGLVVGTGSAKRFLDDNNHCSTELHLAFSVAY